MQASSTRLSWDSRKYPGAYLWSSFFQSPRFTANLDNPGNRKTMMASLRKNFHLLLFTFASLGISPGIQAAEAKQSVLDRPPEHVNTIFHTGIWVEDVDEMLAFLDIVMDYEIVVRANRQAGGERVILNDARGQHIELLSDPDQVKPHPAFPLHPTGLVAGVAHISIWVRDALALEEKLQPLGYEILGRIPDDYASGYASFQGKEYRVLFVNGPGAMTFELFEVKD